jgi:hypothetical protein
MSQGRGVLYHPRIASRAGLIVSGIPGEWRMMLDRHA